MRPAFFISEIAQSPGRNIEKITTHSKCAADFSPGVNLKKKDGVVLNDTRAALEPPEPAFEFGQLGGVYHH